MRKFNNPIKDSGYFVYRWISPAIDPLKIINSLINFPGFLRDLIVYSKMKGAESIKMIDTYPVLNGKTQETSFDPHYFYQDIWAAKKIYHSKPKIHYDIGSYTEFIGHIITFTKVVMVDIRPLKAELDNLKSVKGNILKLPFADRSISSLSSLHVAEHIGLGRYGDRLDPMGTQKACRELSRVLARGGNLYFSLPIGKPRVCFNAHRIHSPQQIIKYFPGLKLLEFSAIDDNGDFIENINFKDVEDSDYACGLFWFTKK